MARTFIYLVFCVSGMFAQAQEVTNSLQLERLPLREDMHLVSSAIAATPDTAAFGTRRGEVWILEQPKLVSETFSEFGWRKYAAGLHKISAIQLGDANQVTVKQELETTVLSDLDQDGVADEYRVAAESIKSTEFKSAFQGFVWLPDAKSKAPFKGQYFGGSRSKGFLSRLAVVEDARGKHSSLFVFQKGLIYPVEAMARLSDNTWLIAQSNRSEPDRSRTKFAVQRATWKEVDPLEVESIKAVEKGFKISFTKALLQETAEAAWSYTLSDLSEEAAAMKILSVVLDEGERSVTLTCEPAPEAGKVYQISASGNWSKDRDPVRNPSALFRLEE